MPDKAKNGNEVYTAAAINSDGTGYSNIQVQIINKSGWPACAYSNLSARYCFTLESGITIS
jgi:hypothetical protein